MSQTEPPPPPGRVPAPKAQLSPEVAQLLGPSLQVGLGAGTRSAVILKWGGQDKISPSDKVKASTIAGASAGVVGGMLRGPRNILPAIAVFSLFGAGGQAIINALPTGDDAAAQAKPNSSWLHSKWSPLTPMTDAQYAAYIDDKILKLDVEIAMLDEKLAALWAKKSERAAGSPPRTDV
ncbi:hypothetical protein SEPCBS119000_005754 [Sporothrix epigloea]|uniref:Uncharacterized protein n=1 Tax=Sporothrix epigloea TaxID=1892477 RepID=A0ABP0DZL7_9PEZI